MSSFTEPDPPETTASASNPGQPSKISTRRPMMRIDAASWQAVSPLLDELLDADAAQRAARLGQLQATDPALANEVAALLAHQPAVESERFLEGVASDQISPGALLEFIATHRRIACREPRPNSDSD